MEDITRPVYKWGESRRIICKKKKKKKKKKKYWNGMDFKPFLKVERKTLKKKKI